MCQGKEEEDCVDVAHQLPRIYFTFRFKILILHITLFYILNFTSYILQLFHNLHSTFFHSFHFTFYIQFIKSSSLGKSIKVYSRMSMLFISWKKSVHFQNQLKTEFHFCSKVLLSRISSFNIDKEMFLEDTGYTYFHFWLKMWQRFSILRVELSQIGRAWDALKISFYINGEMWMLDDLRYCDILLRSVSRFPIVKAELAI